MSHHTTFAAPHHIRSTTPHSQHHTTIAAPHHIYSTTSHSQHHTTHDVNTTIIFQRMHGSMVKYLYEWKQTYHQFQICTIGDMDNWYIGMNANNHNKRQYDHIVPGFHGSMVTYLYECKQTYHHFSCTTGDMDYWYIGMNENRHRTIQPNCSSVCMDQWFSIVIQHLRG